MTHNLCLTATLFFAIFWTIVMLNKTIVFILEVTRNRPASIGGMDSIMVSVFWSLFYFLYINGK